MLLLVPELLKIIFPEIQIQNNLFEASFFKAEARFSDFYDPIRYAADRNLVNEVEANSPPFLHFCSYIIGVAIKGIFSRDVLETDTGSMDFAHSMAGYAVWLTVVVIVTVLLYRSGRLLFSGEKHRCLCFLFAVVCGYPFIYMVDRGNFVFFAAVLIVMFMVDLDGYKTRAAVWIGLAAALKLYPAILGLCFLKRKDWKNAGICAGVGIGATLLSVAFFSSGDVSFWTMLTDWIAKAQSYATVGNGVLHNYIYNNNSMQAIALSIVELVTESIDINWLIDATQWMSMIRMIVLIVSIAACFFMKREYDIFLICTTIMVCYPVESGTYNVILMVIPLLYWLYREENPFIAVVGFVCLMNKSMTIYLTSTGFGVTLHSIVEPICCRRSSAVFFSCGAGRSRRESFR